MSSTNQREDDRARILTVPQLKQWIMDGQEWALIDVQEAGAFANGHIFHASPLPYSRLELKVADLVPRAGTPLVLTDGDGGVIARRAARRLESMGYTEVRVLEGGNAAWAAAGQVLFQGVHVPSKTFGELVEHRCGTPSLSPQEFLALRASGRRVALLDGRPFDEFQQVTIPGSVCCPNGELALRAQTLAAGADVVVVNCAGRTRSIIGAETLRRLNAAPQIYALRNGTQGWFLAGLEVERGATRRYSDEVDPRLMPSLRRAAHALVLSHGVRVVRPDVLKQWQEDRSRTTYLFDVRTAEEFARGSLRGAVHAPGGQLLQATDLWVAVAAARIVVFDTEEVRAPVVAAWLTDMGLDAYLLRAADGLAGFSPPMRPRAVAPLPVVESSALNGWRIVDLRDSGVYRTGHQPGACWSTRARLDRVIRPGDRVAFVADDPAIAAVAALDAREAGAIQVGWLKNAATTDSTPDEPADSDRIDHIFFTAGRNNGNRAAAEQYLAWETHLVSQLGPLEWRRFRPDWMPPFAGSR